jgi:hypothetical protein
MSLRNGEVARRHARLILGEGERLMSAAVRFETGREVCHRLSVGSFDLELVVLVALPPDHGGW